MTVSAETGSPPSVRIGLLVPDVLRLVGIQEILRGGPGYTLVSIESPTPSELNALDLLLIDETGTSHLLPLLETLARARPQLRLLVLGLDLGAKHAEQVIGAGARGYLTHQTTSADLRAAVEVILGGSMWAPRRVLAHLLEQARREAAGRTAGSASVRLSKREVEVLRLLVDGHSNREIAEVLGVDEGTIKTHLSRLMTKAGVRNRTALSMVAMREGWTTGSPRLLEE